MINSEIAIRYVLAIVALLILLSVGYYAMEHSRKTILGTEHIQEKEQKNVDIGLKYNILPNIKPMGSIVIGGSGYGETLIEVYSKLPIYVMFLSPNSSGTSFALMGDTNEEILYTSRIELPVLMKQYVRVRYIPLFGSYKLPNSINITTYIREKQNEDWKFYRNISIPIVYNIYELINIENFNKRIFEPITFDEPITDEDRNKLLNNVYNNVLSFSEEKRYIYGIYANSLVDSNGVYTFNITFRTKYNVEPIMILPELSYFNSTTDSNGYTIYYKVINWTIGSTLYIVFRSDTFANYQGEFSIEWVNIYKENGIQKVQKLSEIKYSVLIKSNFGLIKNNIRDINYNFLLFGYPSEFNSENVINWDPDKKYNIFVKYLSLHPVYNEKVTNNPFLASEVVLKSVTIKNMILGEKTDNNMILMTSSSSSKIMSPTLLYNIYYIQPFSKIVTITILGKTFSGKLYYYYKDENDYYLPKRHLVTIYKDDNNKMNYDCNIQTYYDPLYVVIPYDNVSESSGSPLSEVSNVRLSYTLEGGFPVLQMKVDYYIRVKDSFRPLAISYTTPSYTSIMGQKLIYIKLAGDDVSEDSIRGNIGEQIRKLDGSDASDYNCNYEDLIHYKGDNIDLKCSKVSYALTNKGNEDNIQNALSSVSSYDTGYSLPKKWVDGKYPDSNLKRVTIAGHLIGLTAYWVRDDIPKSSRESDYMVFLKSEISNIDDVIDKLLTDEKTIKKLNEDSSKYGNIRNYIATLTEPPYFSLSKIYYSNSDDLIDTCGGHVHSSCYFDMNKIASTYNNVIIKEYPFIIVPSTLVSFKNYAYHYPKSYTLALGASNYFENDISVNRFIQYPLLIPTPSIWASSDKIKITEFGLSLEYGDDKTSLWKYLDKSIIFNMVNDEIQREDDGVIVGFIPEFDVDKSAVAIKYDMQLYKQLILGTNIYEYSESSSYNRVTFKSTASTGTSVTFVGLEENREEDTGNTVYRVSFMVEISMFGTYEKKYTKYGFMGVPTFYTLLNGMIAGHIYTGSASDIYPPFWVGFVYDEADAYSSGNIGHNPIGEGLKYYQTYSLMFSYSLLMYDDSDDDLYDFVVISPIKVFVPNRLIAGTTNKIIHMNVIEDYKINSITRASLGVIYDSLVYTGPIVGAYTGGLTSPDSYHVKSSYNDLIKYNMRIYPRFSNRNSYVINGTFTPYSDGSPDYDGDGSVFISISRTLTLLKNGKYVIPEPGVIDKTRIRVEMKLKYVNKSVIGIDFIPQIAKQLVEKYGDKMSDETKTAILWYPYLFNPIFPEYDNNQYTADRVVKQYAECSEPSNDIKILTYYIGTKKTSLFGGHKEKWLLAIHEMYMYGTKDNIIYHEPYINLVELVDSDVSLEPFARTTYALLSGKLYNSNPVSTCSFNVVDDKGNPVFIEKPDYGLLLLDAYARHKIVDHFTYPAIIGVSYVEIGDDKQLVNGIMTFFPFWLTTGGLIGFDWSDKQVEYSPGDERLIGSDINGHWEYKNVVIDAVIYDSMFKLFNMMQFKSNEKASNIGYYGAELSTKLYRVDIVSPNNFEQSVKRSTWNKIKDAISTVRSDNSVKPITFYETYTMFFLGLNHYYPNQFSIEYVHYDLKEIKYVG